jgi:2-(1,2-epoxy-1,2-dihydrophenyl)acetyl-CoA isomerase
MKLAHALTPSLRGLSLEPRLEYTESIRLIQDERIHTTGVEPVPEARRAGVDLLVRRDGAALHLTLNRPQQKNALTAEMVDDIANAVESAGHDDATRVIVLQGAGTDFCSGIDLGSNRPGGARAESDAWSRPRAGHIQRGVLYGAHRMIRALSEVQLPVIAGVRGWAAGLGNALALSADVAIVTPSAKLWVPFVAKGFTPDSGSTYLLPRLVGLARAKEMILRGRPIDGKRAAEWGLVSECVAEDLLDDSVAAAAQEFASAATVAVGLAKTLVHRNLDSDFAGALQNEGIYEELALRTDDFKEGMRAFTEKRDPRYEGR